jgi:nucleoside-diphosphate-sugar epimerase
VRGEDAGGEVKSLITGSGGAAAFYLKELLPDAAGIQRPECDLNDFEAVCDKLDTERPDAIFHLASDANVRMAFDTPWQTIANNVLGTVNLFEACRKVGIRPAVQICSSSEVYGNPGRWPINEDFLIAPINPYAISKVAQDLLGGVYSECYDFPVVRTRAFGYVNPRRTDLSLSSFARQIVEIERGERTVLLHGNLDSIRTFCDVRDIARAYVLAIEQEGVFNIGSTQAISIGECLDLLCFMAIVPIKRQLDPARSRPSDVTLQIPDCTAFRQATGWAPKIELRDSLKWLLETYRANS